MKRWFSIVESAYGVADSTQGARPHKRVRLQSTHTPTRKRGREDNGDEPEEHHAKRFRWAQGQKRPRDSGDSNTRPAKRLRLQQGTKRERSDESFLIERPTKRHRNHGGRRLFSHRPENQRPAGFDRRDDVTNELRERLAVYTRYTCLNALLGSLHLDVTRPASSD